MVEGAR